MTVRFVLPNCQAKAGPDSRTVRLVYLYERRDELAKGRSDKSPLFYERYLRKQQASSQPGRGEMKRWRDNLLLAARKKNTEKERNVRKDFKRFTQVAASIFSRGHQARHTVTPRTTNHRER